SVTVPEKFTCCDAKNGADIRANTHSTVRVKARKFHGFLFIISIDLVVMMTKAFCSALTLLCKFR
ncbi:MAG: hypothetical protein K2M71_03725, partial [Duncaniella sp.]|nr:hypothetical protein [Duncaniella sp.]